MVIKNETPTRRTKYSDNDKEKIVAVLEKYNIEKAADLIKHAEPLVFGMALAIFEDETTNSKARKNYLKKLSGQSRKLKNTINEIDYVVLQALLFQAVQVCDDQEEFDDDISVIQLLNGAIWMIGLLSDSSERALKEEEDELLSQKTNGSSEKNGALVALVKMLEIEWTQRGYEPGYNVHKETKELSGPFCSFIEAAVRPVLPEKLKKTSLQHRIYEALKSNYNRSGSSLIEVLGKKYLVSARRFQESFEAE